MGGHRPTRSPLSPRPDRAPFSGAASGSVPRSQFRETHATGAARTSVLLVDHQAGLSSLVRDVGPDKFRNNVLALADLATYFKLPTILTTSFENGPNGPLMTGLKETFPDAPSFRAPARSTPGTTRTL